VVNVVNRFGQVGVVAILRPPRAVSLRTRGVWQEWFTTFTTSAQLIVPYHLSCGERPGILDQPMFTNPEMPTRLIDLINLAADFQP
jgi:hypothetical protein